MEVTTIQKNIRTSPRKLRLAADVVRKMVPAKAVQTLEFVNKAVSLPLTKAIKTALANAKIQGMNQEKLVFKSLEINEGVDYKRYHFVGRGRVSSYRKKGSQIRVVLEESRAENQESEKQSKIKQERRMLASRL